MVHSLSRPLRYAGFALPLMVLAVPASAQLGGLFGAVQDRVEQEVNRQVRGDRGDVRNDDGRIDDADGQSLQINEGFDFRAGARTIVQDDFSDTPIGAMPKEWKTNGSGSVVSVGGIPGNWLALQPFATYKLTDAPQLPASFTVEFDMVIAADTTRDAGGFYFGFTRNNSVQSYVMDAHNDGGIAAVNANFAGSTSVSSSATGYYHASKLDLRDYANRTMHVSIAVDGDMMQVYFDQQKIADAKLFDNNPAKYFFISAPTRTRHGARLLFSNFRLAE
ncbi:hypothetical protein D6851_09255 [Altericroceibacterium spongiae]|uniref:LamG domain-containing protein n=1 Tax=Altericroceibacterium spongiae TaxID=2320269 RepID=A0A420EK62_9SPHN|nr:hypothetical protein [Altericroceibacterium spongiae]RKF21112.1 hypothetical protein D6851_09255 [Altericroceibacterium spongiae]